MSWISGNVPYQWIRDLVYPTSFIPIIHDLLDALVILSFIPLPACVDIPIFLSFFRFVGTEVSLPAIFGPSLNFVSHSIVVVQPTIMLLVIGYMNVDKLDHPPNQSSLFTPYSIFA